MNKKILVLFFILFFSINAFAALSNNLISYYTFDETSGKLIDQIGNNNATNTNVVYQETGIIQEAYGYNGSSSFTSLDSTTGIPTSNEFSWSGWVHVDNSQEQNGYIFQLGGASSSNILIWDWDSSSTNGVTFALNESGSSGLVSNTEIDDGQWHHIVVTYDNLTMRIWIDNDLKGTESKPSQTWSLTNALFGKRSDNANYFDGNIDEVGIWDKNLSDAEINELYNGGSAKRPVFNSINVDFNYELLNNNGDLNLINNSTLSGSLEIIDVNWFLDDTQIGIGETFTYESILPNTDYNFGIFVDTNVADVNDWYYKTVNYPSEISFDFFDENSLGDLNGVTYSTSPNIGSGTLTDNNLDLNLVGITATEYTFTFSKTGYGTRYYTTDLNQFSDIDINFGLLPSELGTNIEFQIYDETETLYTNSFVEFFNWDSMTYAGRLKTDSTAKATFFINPNDANYVLRSSDFDYNAMTLTVNKPKDETNATEIDGNWQMDVGGLAWQSYTDITNSQAIQIYANTAGDYRLDIVDNNGDYFERKYFVSYTGGTTAETLQPYLVPTASAVSTTLYTISGYTQQPIGDVTVKIYKNIEGVGRVLVEQVVTDAKGEALVSLIANDTYEFEVYRNGTLVDTISIVATSTSIYLELDDLGITTPGLESGSVTINFNPSRTKLISQDTNLIQTVELIDQDLTLTFTSMRVIVTNTDVNGVSGNDVNIYDETVSVQTNWFDINSTSQTLNSVSYDTNGMLVVTVIVTTNQGTYTQTHFYSPVKQFDVLGTLGYGMRPFFGCTETNNPLIPCAPMLLAAIFISLIVTIGFVIETGLTGQTTIAGVFLAIMGIFTYFAWVPIGILAIMVVGFIMIALALGGKQV